MEKHELQNEETFMTMQPQKSDGGIKIIGARLVNTGIRMCANECDQ